VSGAHCNTSTDPATVSRFLRAHESLKSLQRWQAINFLQRNGQWKILFAMADSKLGFGQGLSLVRI